MPCSFMYTWCKRTGKCFEIRHKSHTQTVIGNGNEKPNSRFKQKRDALILDMKLIVLTWISILSASVSLSQIKLKTSITSDHKLIKDTKVFIIPPSGFRLLLNSLSYVSNETGASIGAIQSDKSLNSAERHLNKAYFLKRKYKIIEIVKYKINKLSAIWYELEDQFYDRITTKFILVIGDEREHAMIEAMCPKEHPLASLALKKSILSSIYDIDSTNMKKMIPKSN
jgi:hypothetical protein